MNLSVVEEMEGKHMNLDLILIESGGDNITTTFSPALADYFIYIIDVTGGDKYPRKRGAWNRDMRSIGFQQDRCRSSCRCRSFDYGKRRG